MFGQNAECSVRRFHPSDFIHAFTVNKTEAEAVWIWQLAGVGWQNAWQTVYLLPGGGIS